MLKLTKKIRELMLETARMYDMSYSTVLDQEATDMYSHIYGGMMRAVMIMTGQTLVFGQNLYGDITVYDSNADIIGFVIPYDKHSIKAGYYNADAYYLLDR